MGLRTRTARCACERLQLSVGGEPYFISACNCTECQRRTGSAFGVGAYFAGPQVHSLTGESRVFIRSSDSGRPVQFHFCPHCGSTVYWTGVGESVSEGLGIAAGCFADPTFPAPQIIAWCVSKLGWVEFPPDILHHGTQPDSVPGVY
jgi:hypothetical protein